MFFCGVGAGCHARPLMADTRRGGLLVKTVYSHCVRRIENTQSANRGKYEAFSIHGFAGTNVSPYENMASPEPDKPRSLRVMASPERDEPRSLQMMASPERDKLRSLRWLIQNRRVYRHAPNTCFALHAFLVKSGPHFDLQIHGILKK